MGWRFRKSFSPIPGVRLTISPSGVSTSVGAGPFRLSSGPRGAAFTANLPGTGLSFRQPLGVRDTITLAPQPALPMQEPTSLAPAMQEIRSAGSEELTSPGLSEFKRLLLQAQFESKAIADELEPAKKNAEELARKYAAWSNGWLMRRLFKAKFEQLGQIAQEASDRRAELEEQAELARIRTQIEMPADVRSAFLRMCDTFAALAKAQRVWDTVGERSTNRITERTSAGREIDRKLVKFRLGRCELIDAEWSVPHLANANGGDIYLYPAFALYFVSHEAFALLELNSFDLKGSLTRFLEEEGIPTDSKIVGTTWKKVNKNGSPDRRFKDNYEIPIAQYGKLSLTSRMGMKEEYMVSHAEATETFATAWNVFRSTAIYQLATALNNQ